MKISKRNIRLIVAWVCIIAIVLSLVPDRLSRTVEAVGDESGVESVESVPTDPESTPETPTEPESTPETPTEPESTPETPTEPESTPETPTEPESTPETPTEPESTPETPTEPESTPETPEKTGQSDTIDQHQSGTTGQGQSGETEKDNTTETEIKINRTVQVNTTPELNSDFKGRVGDSVTIEINITDEDAHDGKYTVLWKDNGKEIKEDEEKKTEITNESEKKKTVLKYNYVIPYAGKHIVTAVISDENDASYKEEKNVNISGSISFDWEPKDSNSLKRDKAWKLTSTPVGKDYDVFWYVGSLEENQTDLVGYLRGKEESGSDDKNIEMDTAPTDGSESFVAKFEYAPSDTESHIINIVAVPKTLTSGNSGVIRANMEFEASPYEVEPVEIKSITVNEIAATDENGEQKTSFEGINLYTEEALVVSFTNQMADGSYTVKEVENSPNPTEISEDAVNGNEITFPTKKEGAYNFKVAYTVKSDGLDKEADPSFKETIISYTVKKKVTVSLAEGKAITKNCDGGTSVDAKNVTHEMFVVDDGNATLTGVNAENWKYESAEPGENITITNISATDFTFKPGYYEATVGEITGNITANKPDNDTIDLTAENINAEDYSFKVNDKLAIKVRKDYRSLLGTAGWFKAGLEDGKVIELDDKEAEFVKADDFTSAYEFDDSKEGENIQENIYVKTAENVIYGPYTLKYQYDSKAPIYNTDVTIETANTGILSWIFGKTRTAKEGKDFATQEDGALVITAENVTFSEVQAIDATSEGVKASGVEFVGLAAYNATADVDVTKLPYEKTLTILGDVTEKWYICIKTTDKAGNASYYTLDGKVIVDKSSPAKLENGIKLEVDENHSYGKLNISVKDTDSLIKEVKVRLYDGTNAEDKNANDAIKAYGEAVTLYSKADPDTTNLLQLNKDGDSVSDLCYVVVNDEKNKPTGLPENAVVKEAHGAQLSILIEVTDLVGNTVYYDQEGNEIDAKKNEEDGTTFSSLGELGKNTFIIYGNSQVTVTSDKDAVEKETNGTKEYFFPAGTKMSVTLSDLSGTATLEFNGESVDLGGDEYNTERHAYNYQENTTLEPKNGVNTFKLTVPKGTTIEVPEGVSASKSEDGENITYEGRFSFDDVAPTYMDVSITTSQKGILSWIFGTRTAREGKDFATQDDGALVITAEDVTFGDISAEDSNSGVKFKGLAIVQNKISSEEEAASHTYSEAPIMISGSNTAKWYVYIKLVDYAGNTSYYALDGKVIVDKTNPVKTNIAFSVDENHSYGKLDISVKDADSLIKEVKVRLYDGTNAKDENAKDAIKAYGEAVTLYSAVPDTTKLLQMDEDGNSISNLCYVVVNDEKNKPTGLPENAVVKEAHGAQLSILIEVTDLVGNTVYYDQEGNEIDAKKSEDGTDFSSLGDLGKNTFIIYGNPQVNVTTNENQLIQREDDNIFTDLTEIKVSFSDMFSDQVGLSFTQDAEAEAADISLGNVSYDTSKHAYVFDEVTLEPKYGLNNIELKVPAGTKVRLNDDNVGQDQVGWFAKDADTDTYKGSFIFDNVAPVITININDGEANKEEEILYFGLENGVGAAKKPVVTATIKEDYFYTVDTPTLVIKDGQKVVASTDVWQSAGTGTLDSVSGNSVSDNSADGQTEGKLFTASLTLDLTDGEYTAEVIYQGEGAESETYYNYGKDKALKACYASSSEHGNTIVIDYTRPVIIWTMDGSKNVYGEADYFKADFTTQFAYTDVNGNVPEVKVAYTGEKETPKAVEETEGDTLTQKVTVSEDGIYQFKISGGVDKAGNHPVYVAHLADADEKEGTSAIEVEALEKLQGKVNEVNHDIATRNEEGKKAAEEAGEEFEPEALFTIDSYLNSLGTGLSEEDIKAVETANKNAIKPDAADVSEASEEPGDTGETEKAEFTLTSKVKVLDTTAPTADFVVTGSGKHYENDGDYYKDAFEVTFTVEDVNYDLKKVTARTLFNKNSDPKNETGTVISAGEAADGEEQPNTETETHTYSHTVEKNSESEGYYRFTIEGEDKAGNKLVTPSESGSNNAEGTFTSGMKVLDITNPTFYIATLPDPKSAENIEGETVYYGVNTGLKTLTAGFKVFEKNYHKDLIWTGYTDPIKEGKYRDANPVLEKAKNNKAAPSYDPELKIATYNSTIEFNDNNNGVYRFVIAGKDKAGNKLIKDSRFQETAYTKTIECDLEDEEAAYCTYNKVIDTKAPTGTVTIGNYYNATLSAGKLSVIKAEPYRKEKSASGTITVNTTELSPVRIDYPLTSTVSGLSQKNAKDYSYDPATFSTSGEQVFYLAVTLTDRAGNTTNAQKTNKIYLDVTAPTEDELAPIISISATANSDAHGPSGNPLFASGVPFHIVVSDPYAPTGANEQNSRSSGLDLVTYEFKVGNQSQGVHPLKTADAEANNRTGSYKDLSLTYVIDTREVVAPAEYNNNDILLIVTATDHSGNTSNREYKFGIDVTAPKIAVSYDNNAAQNGKYFKDPRTATITVTERNFDPNAITVTTNGGSQSGWSYMNYGGNGDNDTWTKTINYSTDGDYTISASGQDLLGNRQNEATVYNGTAPQDFTIDRTAPVITVSFDNNNSYKDSKYYNSDRTATVQIVEHNFNAADARTETTAAIARGDAPSVNVGGWSSSGDNRYQSLGFTQDGDYTITVNYTDMAGNPAAEVKVDEFTVDKTAPEIKFDNTTVQNGVAYNGVIAPRVTFSDTNYDPSGVTFVMTGLKDSRGKNLVVQEVMNDGSGFGGSVSYSDFARIKANDDIYTATGKIIDRAGNESSVSITFSVNRFGSTFDFNNDEVTHDIVNRYYINDPKNVVLREINVNDVIERKVYMTHGTENIELVEGEDYRLTEDMNGGWKQYVYEFFADNFEEEGLYNIIVQTKDNAGNENSNTYEYINENGEKVAPYRLTFLVDKTEPYSEFEGVNTRQTRYYEDALNLMVGITDNVAVARVQIYVDNELVIDLFDTEEDDALSRTLRENNNSVPLTISSKTAPQTIKVITTDAATNTSLENEWTVVVTRNILAQYFYNRPLFFGSLIGVALLILLLILWKRRKDEEKKKKTA